MRDIYHQYGLLIADFDMDTLTRQLLSGFDTPEDYDITILDDADNLVYTSASSLNRRTFLASWRSASEISPDSGSFSYGNLSVSSYHLSDKTGWTVILSENSSIFAASIKRLLIISTLLFVIMFIIMSTFLMVLTRNLTQPLRQLTDKLTVLDPGENISSIPGSSDNEIIFLTNAIQGYLSEIYDQNQRLTEQRKRTLIAHYDAMEAQLNPHFLYNTLDTIVWLIEGGMTDDAVEMISSLSIFIRTSLSKGNDIIPLSEEERHTLSYLEIQQYRYRDILEFEINIPKELSGIPVPKLSIQPLAENALYHGIKNRRGKGKILIEGREEEDALVLTVSDNGQGMTPERLHEVQEAIRTGERAGFGLAAVAERIALYYGPGYGMKIFSEEGKGTTVEIRLGKNIQPKS